MPSSVVRTFDDPDDYATSVRATTAELTITERGRFSAKTVTVDLRHMWVQRFSDNLPRVSHSADAPGKATFSFRTQPGPSLLRSGVEMLPSTIVRRGQGETFFQKSDGLACFGSVSLPVEVIAQIGATMGGSDLTPPTDTLIVTPSHGALHRLHCLHDAAVHLAGEAPAVIAHSEAALGLEQAFVSAIVGCLDTGDVFFEDRAALRRHAKIMHRFFEVVEENPDQALFIPDLCLAIGVSERTLRACCYETLGTGPTRYLMSRRMSQARRTLRESDRTTTSVTEIAARWGFWNFGRFAGEYKLLFGELPSTTLARPHG